MTHRTSRPKAEPKPVIGPLGEPLTLQTLPPPNCDRWTPKRKAEVVAAVNGGLLTIGEACERYALTFAEFIAWQRAVDSSGILGLRTTKTQYYKNQRKIQRMT